jgi:hypothetical protein
MKFPISRRALLRGVGASLALPWLEAMTPAAAGSPVRMAVLYMPNGAHPGMWTPEGSDRDFQLSPTLEPLHDLKDNLTVLTNLSNLATTGGDGHYVKGSGFLTCTTITKTLGVDVSCNGISMDQVAAQKAGAKTPIASLELGTAAESTGVDKNVGYTRVYGSHIAWSGPATPLAREINPRYVFERLFRAAHPSADGDKQNVQLLDRVMDDAKQLRGQVGAADRQRIDEYLSIVRSLEQRLDRAGPRQTSWKARAPFDPAAKPEGIPKEHKDHVRLMLDMMALAFQTDTTRISTFMFSNEVSNENFAFLEGVTGAHHSLSHHQNDPDKLRQYQLINRWHVDQYAYLLRKLAAMKEGEKSVLDNSMVLFGSALRDGNRHDPHNLPIVLAGGAGGRLAMGRHMTYAPDTPLANLYLRMLDAFGAPVERFADSTGPLSGV